MNNGNGGNNATDILNIISLVVGLQNLQENREQSAQNDVQSANDRQAKFLLQEITKQFDAQNKLLQEQNDMLHKIFNLLQSMYKKEQ